MVDFSHLSEGNSDSSLSRNLSDEFGISNPHDSSNSIEVMGESVVLPSPIVVSSNASDTEDETSDAIAARGTQVGELAPILDSKVQDIFCVAHHFSQQDRIDVVAKRKKNQHLLEFISACGLSMSDVNEFVSKGSVPRNVSAHNMFVKSPPVGIAPSCSPFARKATLESAQFQQVLCVGEELGPLAQASCSHSPPSTHPHSPMLSIPCDSIGDPAQGNSSDIGKEDGEISPLIPNPPFGTHL